MAYFNQVYARVLLRTSSPPRRKPFAAGGPTTRTSSPPFHACSDYEYDRFQDLDLRFVVGGGLGYIAIKDDRKRLDLWQARLATARNLARR